MSLKRESECQEIQEIQKIQKTKEPEKHNIDTMDHICSICYNPMTRKIVKIPCKGNHYFHAKCARKDRNTKVGDTVSCHLCRFEYAWPPELLDDESEMVRKFGDVEMTCQIEHCHLKYPARQHYLHMETHPMDKIKAYTQIMRRSSTIYKLFWKTVYNFIYPNIIPATFPVIIDSSLPENTVIKISLDEKQRLVFEVITFETMFGVWVLTVDNDVERLKQHETAKMYTSAHPLAKYVFENKIVFDCCPMESHYP